MSLVSVHVHVHVLYIFVSNLNTCTHVCLNRRNQLLTYVYVGKN